MTITLQTAIKLTKLAISPLACWPISSGASKLKTRMYNIYSWVALAHVATKCGLWVASIYEYSDNSDEVVKLLSEVCPMTAVMLKVLICKWTAADLRILLEELETFLDEATSEETKVIQFYVDKCLVSHTVVMVCAVLGPVFYIIAPVFTAQSLPARGYYPFSFEPIWIWAGLYITESIIIVQIGCTAILDFMFAILLWYTSARFEMVCLQLDRATDDSDISNCIRKHQEVLAYLEKLKDPLRVMALEVTGIAMFAIITGGFILIRNPPLFIMAKYCFFQFVAGSELFLYAWPADNLFEMSHRIGASAFGCDWIGKSTNMVKNVFMILQRTHIPAIISVDGLLPALSLELYGSVIVCSFSYLTTLHALAG